jgi:hypothetical protein
MHNKKKKSKDKRQDSEEQELNRLVDKNLSLAKDYSAKTKIDAYGSYKKL